MMNLVEMCRRVSIGQSPEVKAKLDSVRLHLVDLYRKNLVKIESLCN